MKTFTFLALISYALLAFPVHAEEGSTTAPAPVAEEAQSAPAGCMPNGGCCGACTAARAQASAPGEAKDHGSHVGQGEKSGGCPCKQARQQSN